MNINDTINYQFPYTWSQENMTDVPKVNLLLKALIERNYVEARALVAKGASLDKIDTDTFKRCLYEFVEDTDLIKFLISLGFNGIYFNENLDCVTPNGYSCGITGRAYQIGNSRVLNLLFANRFQPGSFWLKGKNVDMVKYAMQTDDIELIKVLLCHGYPKKKLVCWIDYSKRDQSKAYQYVTSNPEIQWKSYGLGMLAGKIAEPEKPKFKLFMTEKTKHKLMDEYNKSIKNYEIEKQARMKYINTIRPESLKKYFADLKQNEALLDVYKQMNEEYRQEMMKNMKVSTKSGEGHSNGSGEFEGEDNMYKSYEEDLRETNINQFSFVDAGGNYRRWGDGFIDCKGNYVPWGGSFVDGAGNYVSWGSRFVDGGGSNRQWGDDFVDGAGNYVRVP